MTKIVSPQLHRQFVHGTLVVPSAAKIPAAQTAFADTADESDNDDAESLQGDLRWDQDDDME